MSATVGPLSYKLQSGDRGSRLFTVDLSPHLGDDELLTSIPSIDVSDASVTISAEAVNSATVTDGTRTIAIGKGAQFRAVMNADYAGGDEPIRLSIHYHTDASNIDTAEAWLRVVDEVP